MTLPPQRFRTSLHARGFTLAEVLFAMAIFVFGVLVLVGTLPNGMASMQTARRQAAEVRIFQHLRAVYQAELDRSPVTELANTLRTLEEPATFYFDERGDVMRTIGGGNNQSSFAAMSRLEPATKLPGETDPSPFTRHLRIAVTEHWQDNSALSNPLRHRQRLMSLTLTGPIDPSSPSTPPSDGTTTTTPTPTPGS